MLLGFSSTGTVIMSGTGFWPCWCLTSDCIAFGGTPTSPDGCFLKNNSSLSDLARIPESLLLYCWHSLPTALTGLFMHLPTRKTLFHSGCSCKSEMMLKSMWSASKPTVKCLRSVSRFACSLSMSA